MAFTATKNLPLAATTTGSWPRPAWYSQSLWGRPLNSAMLDPIATLIAFCLTAVAAKKYRLPGNDRRCLIRRGRQWPRLRHFRFDCRQHLFSFCGVAFGLQPPRLFWQCASQIPDAQLSNAGDDEHPAPAECRDYQETAERRKEQGRICDGGERRSPSAAL